MSGLMLTVSSGGVPAGAYSATLASVEPTPADPQRGYGPGLRWTFAVAAGPLAGQTTQRVTSPTPTPRNACGRILAGVVGRELRPGESVDLSPYIGRTYLVIVETGEGGGTRVASVAAAPATA